MRTGVNSLIQRLQHHFSTTRTHPGCVLGIHGHQHPTSIFRFVGEVVPESPPSNIVDVPVQRTPIVLRHSLDVQLFNADDAEGIDDGTTQLVGEVLPPVLDLLPHLPEGLPLLASPLRALRALGELALDLPESPIILLEESGVLDPRAVRQDGELLDPDIDADGVGGLGEGGWFDFHGEAGEPTSGSIPVDGEPFDLPFDGTMLLDPDIPYAGESEGPISLEGEATVRVLEGEGVVTPLPLEPRITWVLSGLTPSPEGLESEVDPLAGVLNNMGMTGPDDRIVCPPVLDHPIGVVEGESPSFLFIGIPPHFEAEVVSSSATFEGCLELGPLSLGREYPEFEGLPHETPPYCMNEYSNNTKMIPALKTRIFSNGGPYPQGKLSSLRSDLPDDLANARSSQVGRAGPQRKSVTSNRVCENCSRGHHYTPEESRVKCR